jgi:16S rRNA (uracil1498-N3)-methyltransferase
MQYLYDKDAGAPELQINGESHRYLFKVRRFHEGDLIHLRNLQDDTLYQYEIVKIMRREALLKFVNAQKETRRSGRLHLIWCVIDIKIIEKTLPMLNQLGVAKITFVYCDRSQRNFKLDLNRIEKILINSSQQCGRSDLMEIEIIETLDNVLKKYSNIAVLDFDGTKEWTEFESVLIGCEGGFSEEEREKLKKSYKIGLKTDLILKSETAAVSIASKLLI